MATINGTTGDDTITGGGWPWAPNNSSPGVSGNTTDQADLIFGDSLNGGANITLGGDDTINARGGNDTVYGQGGNDTVSGGDGNDLIYGGVGNDSLTGDSGNDTIEGGAGADYMRGGSGTDELSYSSDTAGVTVSIIDGTASGGDAQGDNIGINQFENLRGGWGNDHLTGGSTADNVLWGGAGNDTIVTNYGDTAYGEAGDDYLIGTAPQSGEEDMDLLDGGDGNDTILGQGGRDTLIGGAGNDSIVGGAQAESIDAGSGDDTVVATLGNDTIQAGDGIDLLDFSNISGAVTASLGATSGVNVTGGAGSDRAYGFENAIGGSGNDSIFGGSGDTANQFWGGAGNDTLNGGGGNDTLNGGAGNDSLIGGSGTDLADYSSATSDVVVNLNNSGNGTGQGGADVGSDSLTGIENVTGGAGDDSIVSTGNANNLFDGGAGNDTLSGGGGDDTLIGGTGDDWASYNGTGSAVTVTLDESGNGTATGAAGNDTLQGIENILGGSGGDSLTGNSDDNTINGGGGNDTIVGGGGNDSLVGGSGNDSLVGGSGNETIDGGANDDTVVGSAGNDSLVGGGGTNTLDYSGSDAPVVLDLSADTVNDGQGGIDTISDFGNYVLGDGNDTVIAGGGADTIHLGGGDDSYSWSDGGGNDTIYLGGGNDTLDFQGWTGGGDDPWETVDGGDGSTLFYNTVNGGDGPDTITVYGYDPDNDVIVCFAEGTRIATARGEVPVEHLRAGDLVVAAHGGAPLQPLVWVGRTQVNVARQRDRAKAAPILIKAGALASGVPFRDLRVSPEHAIHLDGRLVPARLLVNGTNIVQELWVREVTYYHVELEHHGLVVSEGAVTETYFDDGNRHLFDNAKVAALVVDFEAMRSNGRYRAAACAPVLDEGDAALDGIRARIAARADQPARRVKAG
jgi:Ca2+-binding RTX toxin-like protein